MFRARSKPSLNRPGQAPDRRPCWRDPPLAFLAPELVERTVAGGCLQPPETGSRSCRTCGRTGQALSSTPLTHRPMPLEVPSSPTTLRRNAHQSASEVVDADRTRTAKEPPVELGGEGVRHLLAVPAAHTRRCSADRRGDRRLSGRIESWSIRHLKDSKPEASNTQRNQRCENFIAPRQFHPPRPCPAFKSVRQMVRPSAPPLSSKKSRWAASV